MNCKQGDMAVIIKSFAGNEGKVVQCLEYVDIVCGMLSDKLWRVDRDLNMRNVVTGKEGSAKPYIRDPWLMPITPDDKLIEQFKEEFEKEKEVESV